MPSPFGGAPMPIPSDLQVKSVTTASGYLRGSLFSGRFSVALNLSLLPGVTVHTSGDFEVTLA